MSAQKIQFGRVAQWAPEGILALVLSLSVLVFCAGIFLAQKSENITVPGDRKQLQAVGNALARETRKLEQWLERDLQEVVSRTESLSHDPIDMQIQCGAIVGVEQWSLLHGDPQDGEDITMDVDHGSRQHWPKPTFEIDSISKPSEELLLSKADILLQNSQRWGWVNDPGKPLLFWQRPDSNSSGVIVLLLDSNAIHTAANGWLRSWAQDGIAPLRGHRGPICAIRSDELWLSSTGKLPTNAPNFVFPIRSVLGNWDIISWDSTVVHVSYDFSTVAIAGFLALLIGLLGIIAYLQQARLLADTAERITFVNRVSHELRSPLTNILLNLELARELLPELENQPNFRLNLVQEEVRRLTRMVDNVLSFSSGGNRGTSSTLCHPSEIVQTLIDQFAPAFARRGLTITYHSNMNQFILLNGDALIQIVGNLLSNIEKYVPGGSVTISLTCAENDLTITVADEGPGVPPAQVERIFRPFERLDYKGNEGVTGTGLGLSIARNLALQMGGDLRLLPSEVGATFELRVPFAL